MNRRSNAKRQRGYTLLEYCAGAAIIAGILWTALSALGGNLSGLLEAVGRWAVARTTEISQ
jgi:Flp pilus assembly pilin Flp